MLRMIMKRIWRIGLLTKKEASVERKEEDKYVRERVEKGSSFPGGEFYSY